MNTSLDHLDGLGQLLVLARYAVAVWLRNYFQAQSWPPISF